VKESGLYSRRTLFWLACQSLNRFTFRAHETKSLRRRRR
jgi:hypothetical protein